MTDTQNFTELQILTSKDIANICCIGLRTAQNYMTDIKNHFNVTRVTYAHLRKYLQI